MHRSEAERVAREICAAGGFKFEQLLGAGSFKHAFGIDDHGTKKALKVYKSHAAAQDARTQREIEAITKCNHVGIVRYDGSPLRSWTSQGQQYAFSIEEYLGGGSLEQRLQSVGTLPRDQLISLGEVLVDVIAHLHDRNLVHRDLKPANIMFRDTGEPVVVDFGLVRDLSAASLTQTWAQQGPCSPFYAAPEQLNNQKDLIDWRTDQFALGVVITIAGTGYHPFAKTADVQATVMNVAQRGQATPAAVQWATAVGLVCLSRMLEAWPVRRYRTPSELRAAWLAQ